MSSFSTAQKPNQTEWAAKSRMEKTPPAEGEFMGEPAFTLRMVHPCGEFCNCGRRDKMGKLHLKITSAKNVSVEILGFPLVNCIDVIGTEALFSNPVQHSRSCLHNVSGSRDPLFRCSLYPKQITKIRTEQNSISKRTRNLKL